MQFAEYKRILAQDETASFAWERIPDMNHRSYMPPATYLGAGRGRFWHLLRHLDRHLRRGESICDFGCYPGTTPRLIRLMKGGSKAQLAGAGFGFSPDFIHAMNDLGMGLLEMEFDIRHSPQGATKHILSYPIAPPYQQFDVAVCTEVIEHQMYPLSLLVGMNRFMKDSGTLYLTTNSVSFIGDIAKLLAGRHNIESLELSHVLNDSLWRPHIRLYTLAELKHLLALAGFQVTKGFYFDNGNVYSGTKGLVISLIRGLTSVVPYLRSHIFIKATKVGSPRAEVFQILRRTIESYSLQGAISLEQVRQ